MMSDYQDQYITVNGNKVRYWRAGDQGEHLLLIHGLGAMLEYWQYVIPELSKHYRVIAIDLLGSGKSDKPDVRFDLTYYSQFITDLLKVLGIEKFYLAGHSLGGGLALQVAIDRPDAVQKLFLIDNAGFGRQLTFVFRLMSFSWIGRIMMKLTKPMYRKALEFSVHNSAAITDEFVDQLYPMASEDLHRRTMLQLLRDNADLSGMKWTTWRPVWKKLRHLKALPIFVIWGENDRILHINKHLKRGKKRLPHLKSVVFQHCGHIPMVEYPQRTASLMIDFFNGSK